MSKAILSKLYINLIIFSIIGLKADGKANRLHVIPLSSSNISGQSLLFDQQFYHVTFGDRIQGRRKVSKSRVVVIQGLLKEKVLFLFLPKSGGRQSPLLPSLQAALK